MGVSESITLSCHLALRPTPVGRAVNGEVDGPNSHTYSLMREPGMCSIEVPYLLLADTHG